MGSLCSLVAGSRQDGTAPLDQLLAGSLAYLENWNQQRVPAPREPAEQDFPMELQIQLAADLLSANLADVQRRMAGAHPLPT